MSDKGWKSLCELREVYTNYSGMQYSVEYAEKAGLLSYRYSETGGESHSVGIREEIEISLKTDEGIQYRECKIESKECGYKTKFDTQFGVFHNDNRGEFGGSMISPSGVYVYGNFREVVNHKKKVYAVDSMNHMGLVHFRLLEFTDAQKYREIYSSVDELKDIFEQECLQYGALFDSGDALYIVISGFIKNKQGEYVDHTKLLRIQNSKVDEVFSVDEEFNWINKLIVFEKIAYISMDKVVVSIDLITRHVIYYTNLSELAEQDLLMAQKMQYKKR